MDNLQHWLGDFARLFTLQFTSNEGMSDDSTLCECDVEIDHSTRRLNAGAPNEDIVQNHLT